jgi:riboflavin biosynthesis pyrimidine reductase
MSNQSETTRPDDRSSSQKRPYIVVLVSISLDGRVALGPNRTQWEELADPRGEVSPGAGDAWTAVQQRVDQLHQPQAKMQGSGSFVKEGETLSPLPPFTGDAAPLYQDYLPEEVVNDPDLHTWLVVVDGRGRMRSGYTGEDNPGHYMLHLVSDAAPAAYLAFLQQKKIPYLLAGERWVDLPVVMAKLRQKLGVTSLISVAGGRLNGALLRAGLVDEVNVLFRPELIGGDDTPALFDAPDLGPDEWPTPLRLLTAQVQANGFVWLRYEAARR